MDGMVCITPELTQDPRVAALPDRAWRALILALGLAATDEQAAANVAQIAATDRESYDSITGGEFPIWPSSRWRDLAHFKRHVWSKRNVDAAYERDGKACRYCGRTDARLSIDHVVPRSKGGSDELENLVVACTPCNSRKSCRTPDEAGMVLLDPPAVTP